MYIDRNGCKTADVYRSASHALSLYIFLCLCRREQGKEEVERSRLSVSDIEMGTRMFFHFIYTLGVQDGISIRSFYIAIRYLDETLRSSVRTHTRSSHPIKRVSNGLRRYRIEKKM